MSIRRDVEEFLEEEERKKKEKQLFLKIAREYCAKKNIEFDERYDDDERDFAYFRNM